MPQLYLITPPIHTAREIFDKLEPLTRELPVAAVRLVLAPGFDGPSVVKELKEITQNRDVALLVEDNIDLAIAAKADGVHLTTFFSVAEARRRLGDEANIGVNCMASRHMAMEAGHNGADYVAFGPAEAPEVIEIIQWWSETAALPCLAEGAHTELAARRAAEAGAGFISFTLDEADPATLGWLANK